MSAAKYPLVNYVLHTEASAHTDFADAIACHSANNGHIGLPDTLPNPLKPAMMPTAYYEATESNRFKTADNFACRQ